MRNIFLSFTICILLSCGTKKVDYATVKTYQDYTVPVSTNLFGNEKQSALFIFPHPDDEVVCGGTIAYLKSKGARLSLLTLTTGAIEDTAIRHAEWNKAVKVFGFENPQLCNMPNNSWKEVMNDGIRFWTTNTDSIENTIYNAILRFSPTILFTYDTLIGGYGHPEHRITALATYNVFKKHKNDVGFTVKKIYQITLPEKLEEFSVGHVPGYDKAVAEAGGKNLPEPTIAVNIAPYWINKRAGAACYPSQNNSLTKFNLLPAIADTSQHYHAFDREYYVEIK